VAVGLDSSEVGNPPQKFENVYKKAKELLKNNQLTSVYFKKRKPKSSGRYYFRITKKYRAIGVFDGKDFIVTEISDHQ